MLSSQINSPCNSNPTMASTTSRLILPCHTLSTTPQNTFFATYARRPAIHFPAAALTLQQLSSKQLFRNSRPHVLVRAAGEGVSSSSSSSSSSTPGQASTVTVQSESETGKLKKQLVDCFYGTDRGLRASSETRAEIGELITQLESKNPTPSPTDALPLLKGKWILSYTSFPGLFPLLARGAPSLLMVDEISQTIDSENFTVQNSVRFASPYATTSITTNAKFEVRSPKRVQIKFEEGVIGTPQLTDSIVLPESVEFLGQKIDLTPFKGLITSVQDTASTVAKTISSQPPFKFSIPNTSTADSWLLTTYLDQDLRISRGDAGSVFVLLKEGSPLLASL